MAPTKDRVIPGHRMSIRAGGDGSSAQRWIDGQEGPASRLSGLPVRWHYSGSIHATAAVRRSEATLGVTLTPGLDHRMTW